MKNVRIEKKKLLNILKANLKNHISVYNDSVEEYRQAALKELKARYEKVKEGGKIDLFINLREPENHASEYEKVIGMLKLSCDDVIELDAHSFNMYVLDEWTWKEDWWSNATSYVGATKFKKSAFENR